MSDAPIVYKKLIAIAHKRPLAVFDLDSTLFNVSHRTQKIINDFIQEPASQRFEKPILRQLEKVVVTPQDWGLAEPLRRAGLLPNEALLKSLKQYWNQHFFSSHYLQFDTPYSGAVEFVKSLHASGVAIYYLTGRDHVNMHAGTIESLHKHGLPIDKGFDRLIMKPSKGVAEDEDFKTKKILELSQIDSQIWFFENEPVIIHKVMQDHPNVQIVWVDTTHSGREQPPKGVFTIQNNWSI